MLTAEELYAIVEGYARLGDHRTGSTVDRATTAWLSGLLAEQGAQVNTDLYAFEKFDATCEVTLAGSLCPSLPLWYSGTGLVVDDNPGRAVLAPSSAGDLAGLDNEIRKAKSEDRSCLLVATQTGRGGLFALNREPAEDDLPVILLPEQAGPDLMNGADVRVKLDAWRCSGFSSNLVASWDGAPHLPYVLVTTPLTGWFGCAGERGTGVAVAVSIAAELARQVPVLLIGTTGHELGGLGAKHCLASDRPAPAAVVHVGASAAAAGTDWSLLSDAVLTTVSPYDAEVEAAAARAGHRVTGPEGGWRGEAALWADYGVPQLSVAGAAPLFHTPDDRLPAATSAALLSQVRDGLLHATQLLAAAALDGPAVVVAAPR